jgi:alcohol dehydrogenase class IV
MGGSFEFVHEMYAQRVVFGPGSARSRLAEEVQRLNGTNVLLDVSEGERPLAEELTRGLPVVGRVDEVRMHVPVSVAEAARRRANDVGAHLLLSIGGGSAVGTAKAVALTSGIPVLAVPTTYAGSEATPVWGLTDAGRKTTGTDARVLPRTVIYDAELSVTLPVGLSVASGLNALAHCVDSQWAPRADPINRALALEGARALTEGLRLVHADPGGLAGRSECLYGAYLAALSFASAGSGLHHKICHVLGGTWDLPHAQTHAVVLPHVLAFNAPSAPEAATRMAAALGTGDALAALLDLEDDLEAPTSLRQLGMPEDAIPKAAALVAEAAPQDNPRPVDPASAEELLRSAWAGRSALRSHPHLGER